jgi:NitT/TauT family transport system substrate-binding protein
MACFFMLAGGSFVHAADKVTLATNWLAQPELGGFYQAVVDGTYAKHGLEVSIKPGGPMVNNRPLLSFGRVDFLIGTNLLQAFDAVKQGIPTKVVAAYFQRDPQCLLAHADGPWRTWDDLKQAPLMMGNSGRQTFFVWLNAAHGFPKANLRPYNHNLAPFVNDKRMVVQGFVTAEPKRIEEAIGKEPRVFLLADHGWDTYSTILETRTELIEKQPELVRRFVAASSVGWRHFLDGEQVAAVDALIKKENPSMTDGLIAYSRRKMRELELIDGGDAKEHAIGFMKVERVRGFYAEMVKAGMYEKDEVDPAKAVMVEFVGGK